MSMDVQIVMWLHQTEIFDYVSCIGECKRTAVAAKTSLVSLKSDNKRFNVESAI